MAADLAEVVKGLHKKLREDLKAANGDYDKVWKSHCSDKDKLETYAKAMHSLATSQWSKNSPGGRADWCVKICQEYFRNGGLDALIEKQKKRIDKDMGTVCCCCLGADSVSKILSLKKSRLNLLDVGSCHNPFEEYKEEFVSLAIDLCPATETVFKCDFLELKISSIIKQPISIKDQVVACICEKNDSLQPPSLGDNKDKQTSKSFEPIDITKYFQKSGITELPGGNFHVVVFSLLLSYFPSPIQRWNCCLKAHELLAINGILIIITPDSSHQNRNVDMVKSWKVAIESIGFVRWRYIKDKHVHCMVFRKVSPCHHSCSKTCSCKVNVNVKPEMLFIRQDFQDDGAKDDDDDRVKDDGHDDYSSSSKRRKLSSSQTP